MLSAPPLSARAAAATPRRFGTGRWSAFLLRRLIRAVVAMLVIVTAAFIVLRASGGDPVRAALGVTADDATVEARRIQLGLDQPILVQFVNYLGGILHGDLGISLITGRSVSELVADRLPATVELAALAFVVVLLVAIPAGLWFAVLTANRRRRGTELGFTSVTGVLASIPDYLVGVGLVILFSITFSIFPVAGRSSPESYVLPVIALSLSAAASLSRIARVETLATLRDDYVRTARSKRLPPAVVLFRHVLPNMLTGVLTIGGTLLATMIASSVLVERVFNWPGMGTAFVDAIVTKDYGIVQGLSLVYGAIILAVALLIDIVLALLDRRTTILETA
jgi:peptide/nickel transport system permease protein